MTSTNEIAVRRKSSTIAALMTLNCSSIPIINEPNAGEQKKKAIRFDTKTITNEYEEDYKASKRRSTITEEIRKWVKCLKISNSNCEMKAEVQNKLREFFTSRAVDLNLKAHWKL